jgi:hypothetical protein
MVQNVRNNVKNQMQTVLHTLVLSQMDNFKVVLPAQKAFGEIHVKKLVNFQRIVLKEHVTKIPVV